MNELASHCWVGSWSHLVRISTKVINVLLNPQQCGLLVVEARIESSSAVFRCRGHFSGGDEPKYVCAIVE